MSVQKRNWQLSLNYSPWKSDNEAPLAQPQENTELWDTPRAAAPQGQQEFHLNTVYTEHLDGDRSICPFDFPEALWRKIHPSYSMFYQALQLSLDGGFKAWKKKEGGME